MSGNSEVYRIEKVGEFYVLKDSDNLDQSKRLTKSELVIATRRARNAYKIAQSAHKVNDPKVVALATYNFAG